MPHPDIDTMTNLEKEVNAINEEYFLPLMGESWKEDYTSEEFHAAKHFLAEYLPYFENIDHKLLLQVFKSHIKYFKWVNNNFEKMDDDQFAESSTQHLQFLKMIPGFIRVMRSFQFALPSGDEKQDLAFEKKTKLFAITRVTFEGKRKNNKVVLEGQILDVLQAFFDVLGRVQTEDQLRNLQIFSDALHASFWSTWFDHIGKKSKVKRRFRPGKNRTQSLITFRNMKAYQFHRFLTAHSTLVTGTHISEKEKRFIGNFFLLVKLAQDDDPAQPLYLDTTHYNDVRNWILRGEYL